MPNSAVWKYRMFLLHILIAVIQKMRVLYHCKFFRLYFLLIPVGRWTIENRLKNIKMRVFFLSPQVPLPSAAATERRRSQMTFAVPWSPSHSNPLMTPKKLWMKTWSLFNHLSGKPEKISSAKTPLHFLVPSLNFCKISVFVFLTL